MKAISSAKIGRWLGEEGCETLSRNMRGWYGPPIAILNVPGEVYVDKYGDFCGRITAGGFMSLMDYAWDLAKGKITKTWGDVGVPQYATCATGFASIAALRSANEQRFNFDKAGTTSLVGVVESLWRLGSLPAAGAAAAAAPGGTVPTSASTGAVSFKNADSGKTLHLVDAMVTPSIAGRSFLAYDRIFAVAKTMSSTATEAVTGVPTRYQSTTQGAADSAEGNFLFIEVGLTALSNTAHNWTTCTYTDQSGNAGATLPSVTGVAQAVTSRLDMPVSTWFAPLAAGDSGIQALTQMQCSASVATGAIDFVIGHPLYWWLPLLVQNHQHYFSGINSAPHFGRVFDDACVAFLDMMSTTSSTSYRGYFGAREG